MRGLNQGRRVDWAGTKRYLNIVRNQFTDGGPSGNATDFPIFSNLPSEQILAAFCISSVCSDRLSDALMPTIGYKSSGFSGALMPLNGGGVLNCTWQEIAWGGRY